MQGWIKLHRQLLEWEWYDDHNTKILFIHILLTANHIKRKWRSVTINEGELLTSTSKLSTETGLSTKQVRVSLNKLKETGEVAIKTTNKYSVISIINWIDHQQGGKQEDKRGANKGQTKGKPTRGTKNVKNDKNDKKGIEEEITKSSIKYLEDVETIKDIANEYSITLKSALFVRDNLIGWCKENGKKKKNYRATLQNWIRRDLQRGNIKKIVINQTLKDLPAITDKQRAMNLKKINEIKNRFKVGHKS